MKQEVYRFAFDEANSELSQILGEFEQLRLRKDTITQKPKRPQKENKSSE